MNEADKALWDFHETQNRSSFVLARPRLDYLKKQVTKNNTRLRVLDIGIGDGYLLEILSGTCVVSGMDLSESNVKLTLDELRKKHISADIRIGSIENIPFEDCMFDVVIASDVLEHLETTTLKNGVGEIRRVLKKGGKFVGTVPADEQLRDSLCYCPKCGYAFHRWGHKQSFNPQQIQDLFSLWGSQPEKIKRVTFFVNQQTEKKLINNINYHIVKTLFVFLRKIIAPQWWYYFQIKKD